MPSLNKAILIGNITADPELKQTPTGVSVCSFAIGVSRRFKDASGNYPTDFINIVAWRQTAEFVSKYFRKGSPICIVGSIQVRNYTDAQGNKRYITEVVADEASFVASKQDSAPQNPSFAGLGDGDIPQANTYQAGAESGAAQPTATKFEEISTDDDLPF